MRIGQHEFNRRHTYIMGILNVTPDSFSDGGRFQSLDRALEHARAMIQAGADILDVGGESTRPGYEKISDEEETERVVPVIRALKEEFDIPVSLDTYKSGVAREGLRAGADLINDIWGLQYDGKMAGVIAEAEASVCIMHNREKPVYQDFLEEVRRYLADSLELALEAGIPADKIILDPGVGFGKNREQNLLVLGNLEEFTRMGYPVLLGASRKSVIGLTLDLPVQEREEGTLAATAAAVEAGCRFVRVHNVQASQRFIRMAEAIREAGTGGR